MRTTLDIDGDILKAAKEIAAARKTNAGKVISDLARRALKTPPRSLEEFEMWNGFPQFPHTGEVLTDEMVQDLIDEEDRDILEQMQPGK